MATGETSTLDDAVVFPNPTYDLFTIEFNAEPSALITINLVDMNGHILRQLYHDTPKAGENRLTFNKGALAPGTYLLSIQSNTKILKNETIVVLD